jgi:hypothetical protein
MIPYFQTRATEQGRAFSNAVAVMLRTRHNCAIIRSDWIEPITLVEVDHVAEHPIYGEIWVECKGSWEGERPGLIRTDTTKKAIANAVLLSTIPNACPFWLIASHLPKPDSAGAVWLKRTAHLFARIELL